jgi:hypothetical protein
MANCRTAFYRVRRHSEGASPLNRTSLVHICPSTGVFPVELCYIPSYGIGLHLQILSVQTQSTLLSKGDAI